ncbi:rhodanese-like domain-containing protein [Natronoglomus mannanivorans]|uniref:Rhodanese-like domain-containing protein n=1 Tax=Natronoglomus mannanivorans TaxID=2979990 RepID=A0AAP2YXN7_9EURY|nr:rhodanese-like domain-containing protein [Halobacteria archaeon AArc-xg1-1]
MGRPDLSVVSPCWLSENRETVTVVDVRDPRAYTDRGHVPGAVNVPAERFRDPSSVAAGKLPEPAAFAEELAAAGIDPDDTIVAYDDEGGPLAARLLLTAVTYGHRGDLFLLDGGIDAWRDSGSLSTEKPPLESATYDADRPPADDSPLVDREEVEAAVDSESVVVDTRTRAEHDQSHVPSAVQLDWEDLLDEDRRLKPRAELEDLLESRGITPDRRTVLYCNTARRLSHTYVVLNHLGYDDVAYYEGSLTDWLRADSPDWDPLELQAQVRAYADRGFDALVADLGEDVLGRLKLAGLYHQKQRGFFMLRTKVPGGELTAEQARVIGGVADEFARAPDDHGGESQNPIFGDGYLDLTTRQDVQMHWIRLEDIPEIWDRYEAVGLTTLQACGNSVRNVVSCPAAGIDANETIDVRPQVTDVTQRFLGDRVYGNLPRKLKVSITGCHENCARAQINDLGFTPAVKDGRDGFAVHVGGGLSDGPRMASDLEIFVEPDQVSELVAATAEVFKNHGSYLDTAVNRLRYLVEEWGVERFREELERAASFEFEFEPAGESLTTDYRGDHVGVHEQDDGRFYVGLAVPVGRMAGAEFATLADHAGTYGDGELRLTPNQNLLVPHVAESDLEALRSESILERYSPDPGPFTRGVVTCTGSEFCSYGVIETKNRAIRWARQLDEWAADRGLDEDHDAIRLHMSGCSASCAQPQIADIGLRGEVYRDDSRTTEAVDVGLGGDLGAGEFVDWVAGKVPVETIPAAVERLVLAYDTSRRPDESVTDWTDRIPDHELRGILSGATGPEEVATGRETETETELEVR